MKRLSGIGLLALAVFSARGLRADGDLPNYRCRLSADNTRIRVGSQAFDTGLIEGVKVSGGSLGGASPDQTLEVSLQQEGEEAPRIKNQVGTKGTIVARIDYWTNESIGTVSSQPETDKIPHLSFALGWVKDNHVQLRADSHFAEARDGASLTLPITSEGITARLTCAPQSNH